MKPKTFCYKILDEETQETTLAESTINPKKILDTKNSDEGFHALLELTDEFREKMGFDAFFSAYYEGQYITSSEL
ncbi:hypothetical protein [Endozoicomonas sp. ALC066]|uniref:hypothetical protein n=1 Tax=Endozoicomonas sp. ALC066 TaxID=3403078 RepID=UPI003BB4D0F5